jgi:hypothetical protein
MPGRTRQPLGVQLAEVTAQRNARDDELVRLQQQFDAFKAKVRETAIQTAQDNNFCNPGLNEVLESLGLPVVPTQYEVEVEITATQVVKVRVDAEELDDADRNESGARSLVGEWSDSDFHYEVNSDNWVIAGFDVKDAKGITDN